MSTIKKSISPNKETSSSNCRSSSFKGFIFIQGKVELSGNLSIKELETKLSDLRPIYQGLYDPFVSHRKIFCNYLKIITSDELCKQDFFSTRCLFTKQDFLKLNALCKDLDFFVERLSQLDFDKNDIVTISSELFLFGITVRAVDELLPLETIKGKEGLLSSALAFFGFVETLRRRAFSRDCYKILLADYNNTMVGFNCSAKERFMKEFIARVWCFKQIVALSESSYNWAKEKTEHMQCVIQTVEKEYSELKN